MSGAPSNWTPGEADMRPHGGNSKRFKEDTEVLKSRLADQHFDMKKYPDPLKRRDTDRSHTLPRGVAPEMEKRWLADIEKRNKA